MMNRRTLLKAATTMPLAAATANFSPMSGRAARLNFAPSWRESRVKLSCNLYSFNAPLRDKRMTLDEVLEFCAELGFDAVDPTAYYFPNYPELPDDAYIYRIKRQAFRLGLDISGTGTRNDFTLADQKQRAAEVERVKRWVGFAARLGAPVLRVFSGKGVPKGHTAEEVTGWVVEALRACADYAGRHGVMIVLQNHADFIETADQVLRILRAVNSEWLAVNLDIGSFRIGDPYAEIAKVAPYAATWQIKENLFVEDKEEKTDLSKIVRIVREAKYRGYLPIETLGAGDPRVKVPKFLAEVRKALSASV
ncbi:MAG TPA: sugar phosphate isomerase/epimerase family protein [Pyrinomonadaceae bacterium]|nr:sugar phosphate isomerase/epimerase family protein [Pyrinomonadaceae bacterium]